MFADPQSITINAVANLFPRITSDNGLGEFATSDGKYRLVLKQNSSAKRFRREGRLTMTKIAADPLTAVNQEISASVYLVIDEPKWGFTDADLVSLINGFKGWAISPGPVDKLLGGEI